MGKRRLCSQGTFDREMLYTESFEIPENFGDCESGDGTETKSFKPDLKMILISRIRMSFWPLWLAIIACFTQPIGFPVGDSMLESLQEPTEFNPSITTRTHLPRSITLLTAMMAFAAPSVPMRRTELSTAGMTKGFITGLNGGTLKSNGVTLRFGAGCLSKDTQITMIEDCHNFTFKSLVDLELLKVPPRVLEFLPDGLEFTKSADLTVQLGKHLDSLELFVSHGSYDSEMERTIWRLVTDDIEVNSKEGYVNMKINGFCFYSYILSTRGKIARILSHLNHSFSCHAVALYRRMPASPKIDVAVVLLSEFVESHEDERNSSQLVMMVSENNFCRSEKGALKRVDTHRCLEMCVEFPGKDDLISHSFKVDVPQLDSVGMVLDESNFREITQEFPARGKVLIYEIHRNNKRLLWTLNIAEGFLSQIEEVQCTAAEGMTKGFITGLDGGTLKTNGVTLRFGTGCLSKDTQITMIEDCHNFAFKSLVDLELLKVPPRVLEFLPDGLEFTKPADLTVQLGKHLDSFELFVLHGSYDSEMERTIWRLVTDDIEVNSKEGYVNMKINGFCFYSYILSTRGKIARILSHLNHSFSCHAVALYRRMPASPKIDVAVVLLSEFVESHEDERNSSQLVMMVSENNFCRSEKGALKRVDTHRGLEMCVEFPGKDDLISHSFKVDVPQLDSVGMVLDESHFREIVQDFPVRGKVLIYEIHRNNKRLLWTLNIAEIEEVQCTAPEEVPYQAEPAQELPVVVRRTTRLSNSEISRLSCCVGLDWDGLTGLLDIPYAEREELRFNVTSCPGLSSKAEVVLDKFNKSKLFCRKLLITIVEELGRHDLRKEIVSGVPETDDENEENPERPKVESGPIGNNNDDDIDDDIDDVVVLRDTPMSSREMYRISRQIVDWESLAGLMDISQATKADIRCNAMYPDAKSRTEKVLSIFNNKKEFCREKLVGFLKEIGEHELISTVITGSCRCL